jgi:SAM-dependent methyltransferase
MLHTPDAPVRLNLGCGRWPLSGWLNVDAVALPGVDLVVDLEKAKLPLPDDSVTEIVASHFLEHIREPLPLMQELHRVARADAIATFRVPYGSSDDADEDPTHVRRYFWGSWGYFSQPYYWRADYGYRGDWEVEDILLTVDADLAALSWEEALRSVQQNRNVVKEMVAKLRARKPIREPLRLLQQRPLVRFAVG